MSTQQNNKTMKNFLYNLYIILHETYNFIFENILKYSILNDAPYPGQIGFQDPASPGFTGISDLHDNVFFYLIIILLGVV